MSTVDCRREIAELSKIINSTEALEGAYAEGVDLGTRAAQIRLLGRSLETMVGELRLKLACLGNHVQIDTSLLDLDHLTRMARWARSYGIDNSA